MHMWLAADGGCSHRTTSEVHYEGGFALSKLSGVHVESQMTNKCTVRQRRHSQQRYFEMHVSCLHHPFSGHERVEDGILRYVAHSFLVRDHGEVVAVGLEDLVMQSTPGLLAELSSTILTARMPCGGGLRQLKVFD